MSISQDDQRQQVKTCLSIGYSYDRIAMDLNIALADFIRIYAKEIEERAWLNEQMEGWTPEPYVEDSWDAPREVMDGRAPALVQTPYAVAVTPAQRANIPSLAVTGWSEREMAEHEDMSLEVFRATYAAELRIDIMRLKAKVFREALADALKGKPEALRNLRKSLGVFVAAPPPTHALPRPEPEVRERFGGPIPAPGPDGRVVVTMRLGDFESRRAINEGCQRRAREEELLRLRAAARLPA